MQPKIIVMTCNWGAFSGMETAGAQHLEYPADVLPIKVKCLGQLSPGIILKAFEKGADGVLLLGCPPGSCHFEFGNLNAEQVFKEAQNIAVTLGIHSEQLQLEWLAEGDGQGFVYRINTFIDNLVAQKVRT